MCRPPYLLNAEICAAILLAANRPRCPHCKSLGGAMGSPPLPYDTCNATKHVTVLHSCQLFTLPRTRL